MGKERYIRIGTIPKDEKSKVWRGGVQVGEEIGVSCYDALFSHGKWNIVIPSPINEAKVSTLYGLLSQLGLLYKVDDPQRAYLVEGDYVGNGVDGEPLLRNVRIVEDITDDLAV